MILVIEILIEVVILLNYGIYYVGIKVYIMGGKRRQALIVLPPLILDLGVTYNAWVLRETSTNGKLSEQAVLLDHHKPVSF